MRVADGPTRRIRDMGNQHRPGEAVWPVDERTYYRSDLPPHTPLGTLAGTIKSWWICERAHRQLKEEPGLDHVEGRSWTGPHRHALRTMIA